MSQQGPCLFVGCREDLPFWKDCGLLSLTQPWDDQCHLHTVGTVLQMAGELHTTAQPTSVDAGAQIVLQDSLTLQEVSCARYAARRSGLTAVPVFHGTDAVVMTHTYVESSTIGVKLSSPPASTAYAAGDRLEAHVAARPAGDAGQALPQTHLATVWLR
jgi:hypothetical protein